jgi:hypothetical protein
VEHDFPKNQFAHHSTDLLGVDERSPKLLKHYHAAQ